MPTAAAELVFDEATKVYPGREGAAVDHLSLTVPAGEICVLVGPSGGGKTTALKLVNRLIPLTSGYIRIDGRQIGDYDVDRAAPLDRLRHPAGRPLPAHDGGGEHRHGAAGCSAGSARGSRSAPPSCSSSSGSTRRTRSASPRSSPAVSASASGSHGRSPPTRPLMLMDEPFGAIDPIVRSRLQDEFLRLQRELRKTVVFVTHDIDEAIKVGDRIAILREGGKLAQYDTPQQILEHPVDDFVADFVGRDRALKALALKTLGELELSPATEDGLPRLPADTSLRDALALLIAERRDALVVVGADGAPLGVAKREDLLK